MSLPIAARLLCLALLVLVTVYPVAHAIGMIGYGRWMYPYYYPYMWRYPYMYGYGYGYPFWGGYGGFYG